MRQPRSVLAGCASVFTACMSATKVSAGKRVVRTQALRYTPLQCGAERCGVRGGGIYRELCRRNPVAFLGEEKLVPGVSNVRLTLVGSP